jgi:hypothetical protein
MDDIVLSEDTEIKRENEHQIEKGEGDLLLKVKILSPREEHGL